MFINSIGKPFTHEAYEKECLEFWARLVGLMGSTWWLSCLHCWHRYHLNIYVLINTLQAFQLCLVKDFHHAFCFDKRCGTG